MTENYKILKNNYPSIKKTLKKKRISRVLVEMWALEALQARGQDRRNMTEIGGKRTLIHNGIKLN